MKHLDLLANRERGKLWAIHGSIEVKVVAIYHKAVDRGNLDFRICFRFFD